jgi:hypothetical protein
MPKYACCDTCETIQPVTVDALEIGEESGEQAVGAGIRYASYQPSTVP